MPHSLGSAEVEVSSLESATVISIAGEVDTASQEQLRLAARWAADRDLPVRIDVTRAALLDTSGMQLFSRLLSVERDRGRRITVVGASSRIKASLQLTGLADLLSFEDS